jgi:hypothetical protein
MTPALASESLATRMLAPVGIVTRTALPVPLPQPTAANESASAEPRMNRLARELQRMLKKYRRRQGIDVALSTLG